MSAGAIARAVAIVALAALVLVILYQGRDALLMVYISVLLATGLGPLVNRIEHAVPHKAQRLPRWLAILVIYIAIVGVLTVVGLMVFPPMVRQAQGLWQQLPDMFGRVQTFLVNYGLLEREITLEEAVRNAPGSGQAVGTVASAVTSVFAGILGFITVLILTFYLLVESETLFAGFVRLFPGADRPRVERVALKIATKIAAWLSGQLMLGGTIGLTAALGLYLLGVPYFYVLAVLAGVGEMVPVVGPIFAALPAIAVAATVSPQTALFTALFFLGQQQVENHLLVPKLMERQVGVSPVIVIVALLIGGTTLGILGALLAVPTAAIVQVITQELLDERDRAHELQNSITP